MAAEERTLETIKNENSMALKRLENLYLALSDLEAFERAVLEVGKNYPEQQTLRRTRKAAVDPSHAN